MPYKLLIVNSDVNVPLNNWKFQKSEVKFVEEKRFSMLSVSRKHFVVI